MDFIRFTIVVSVVIFVIADTSAQGKTFIWKICCLWDVHIKDPLLLIKKRE